MPSFLQEEIRACFHKNATVYNFGRGSYYSTQERVLLEKLLVASYNRNLAIFIDGLNDFYWHDDEAAKFTSHLEDYMNRAEPDWPAILALIDCLPISRLIRLE